jgi:hypothetical protein
VEGGLGHAALAQPIRVFARDETVAERDLQLVVKRTLVVVAIVVLQNVPDVIRVGDEEAVLRSEQIPNPFSCNVIRS